MRLGIIKDVDWKYVGALLAVQDEYAQVDFLQSFLKECNGWGTKHQVEMQFAYINKRLSASEKDQLSMITYKGDDE